MFKRFTNKIFNLQTELINEVKLFFGNHKIIPQNPSQAVKQWLAALDSKPLPKIRGRILITMLRNRTWIEWAPYCACVIRRLGFESTLVYDGSLIKRIYSSGSFRGDFLSLIKKIPGIELVDLNVENNKPLEDNPWFKEAFEWSPTALAYDIHIEEDEINSNPEKYAALLRESSIHAAKLADNLDKFLNERKFYRAFCYSGLIAESKVLLSVLLSHKIETICFEGWGWRPGHILYNLNAPALEYNTAGWLNHMGPWDEEKEKEIDSYGKFLESGKTEDSAWLNNFYKVQRGKVDDSLAPDLVKFLQGEEPIFLLAPNVIADSSMLGRHTIFTGQIAWLKEVVKWFSERPHLKLVIRAHPGEVWAASKCIIHMGPVSRELTKGLKNVFVIDGTDTLNIFSLIPYARAGLVWLSSAGADFVVRGLPALVAAKPKYTGMGIVEEPKSKEAYFEILERWSLQQERPNQEQITQGKRYLHMVFKGFSFEAVSPDYLATGLIMDNMPNPKEHDHFYRIIVGDDPMPDVVSLEKELVRERVEKVS